MRPGKMIRSLVLLVAAATAVEAQPYYRFESVGTQQIASESQTLFYPSGVAIDAAGTIWVADTANHVIRTVTADGQYRVMAGMTGVEGSRDGSRVHATFSYPQGLAFDTAGNLYIADSGNGVIRRLRTDGIVETWAGDPAERGMVDGDRFEARFVTPVGLAWDFTGEVWVTDYSAHTIRRIDSEGQVTTVSGIAGEPGYRNGAGERARFHYPSGIDIDSQGRLWVADTGNGLIRFVTHDGFTGTIAGMGTNTHRDGTLEESGFDHPADVVIDGSGTAFVADSWSHTIRMIREGEVSTIAGLAGMPGYRDGMGSAARFDHPLALALGSDGSLVVADMVNHALRQGTEDGFSEGRRRSIRR